MDFKNQLPLCLIFDRTESVRLTYVGFLVLLRVGQSFGNLLISFLPISFVLTNFKLSKESSSSCSPCVSCFYQGVDPVGFFRDLLHASSCLRFRVPFGLRLSVAHRVLSGLVHGHVFRASRYDRTDERGRTATKKRPQGPEKVGRNQRRDHPVFSKSGCGSCLYELWMRLNINFVTDDVA